MLRSGKFPSTIKNENFTILSRVLHGRLFSFLSFFIFIFRSILILCFIMKRVCMLKNIYFITFAFCPLWSSPEGAERSSVFNFEFLFIEIFWFRLLSRSLWLLLETVRTEKTAQTRLRNEFNCERKKELRKFIRISHVISEAFQINCTNLPDSYEQLSFLFHRKRRRKADSIHWWCESISWWWWWNFLRFDFAALLAHRPTTLFNSSLQKLVLMQNSLCYCYCFF